MYLMIISLQIWYFLVLEISISEFKEIIGRYLNWDKDIAKNENNKELETCVRKPNDEINYIFVYFYWNIVYL